jgi:GTPase Era involved in 16S rRNA processing
MSEREGSQRERAQSQPATRPAAAAPAAPDPLAQAAAIVDLGLKACEAYDRPDLAGRLATAKQALANPGIHIVVVGEFKQGKSSLVNALLGATVCPVDDDVATAVPTYVRFGAEAGADLLLDGLPPRRQAIALDEIRRYVVESSDDGLGMAMFPPAPGAPAAAGRPADRVTGVEVRLPRKMLSGGLIVVDTPGVGGLGSAHAAASLAAISMANAVLFVTDASQELTRSEVDFLRRARDLCDTVVCALTKIDFYPAWRIIKDLDERHLRDAGGIPLLAVSSALRSRAVKTNDTTLNAESGFAELVSFVNERVAAAGATAVAAEAAAEVVAVCQQVESQFSSERAALADPAAAAKVISELTATRERVEALKSAAAKWMQTLSDGIADVSSDIDHDMRARIRQVIQEAEDALEASDPADTWAEMEVWLESRTSYELLTNYALLRERAEQLSAQVADHFREASGEVLNRFAVYNPAPLLDQARIDPNVKVERMTAGKQTMVALRGTYGGLIMFTMLSSLAHIALGPLGLGIGLVMGRKSLREEKERQLTMRRSQAKNAVRRYCDEVTFVAGKDSRDTLRRIQRQLRDHYSARAEELNKSNAQALAAATEAAKRGQAEREKRLKDLDAELARLRTLGQRAAAMVT